MVSYMVPFLGFSDTQVGVLTGYGYALALLTAGPCAAHLNGKLDPHLITCVSLALFGVCTVALGLFKSFVPWIILRSLCGCIEGFFFPATYLILGSSRKLISSATSLALYSSSIYLGAALASLSSIIKPYFGIFPVFVTWGVLLICSCFFSASLFCTCFRKTKGAVDATETVPLLETTSAEFPLEGDLYIFTSMLIGMSFRVIGGFTLASFIPTFFLRNFPLDYSSFGLTHAMLVGVVGTLSVFSGGFLNDYLSKRYKGVSALIPLAGAFLSLPFLILCFSSHSFFMAISMYGLAILCAEVWYGPACSTLMLSISKKTKALQTTIFTVAISVIGNCGPLIVGLLDDCSWSLGESMILVISSSYIAAAVSFCVCFLAILRLKQIIGDSDPLFDQEEAA